MDIVFVGVETKHHRPLKDHLNIKKTPLVEQLKSVKEYKNTDLCPNFKEKKN